jgi:hypothetical protein
VHASNSDGITTDQQEFRRRNNHRTIVSTSGDQTERLVNLDVTAVVANIVLEISLEQLGGLPVPTECNITDSKIRKEGKS